MMPCKYCGPLEWPEDLSSPCAALDLHTIKIRCEVCNKQEVRYTKDPNLTIWENLTKACRHWNIQQFLPKPVRKPYY